MKYVDASVGSTLTPKLLGTYEIELHEVIEEIIAGRPDAIFNIGAGEGYYTVGFARALPKTRVLTWEISRTGQALSKALASLNAVSEANIERRGFCSVSELARRLQDFSPQSNITLVVDVEGGEALLLDPEIIPRLKRCNLLVEIHECFIPGVRKILLGRFGRTHSVKEIRARSRTVADWPEHIGFYRGRMWDGAKMALMNERRPAGMSWLYLRAEAERSRV